MDDRREELRPGAEPASEQTSIWKKEISFRRKRKEPEPPAEPVAAEPVEAEPPAAEPKPEKTSIWKKEIGFRRKPKEEQPEPAAAEPSEELAAVPASWPHEPEAAAPEPPSDAPEPEAPEPPTVPASPAPVPAPAASSAYGWPAEPFEHSGAALEPWADEPEAALELPAAEPPPEKTSIWKREIGFRRKPREEQPEPAAAEPSEEPAAVPAPWPHEPEAAAPEPPSDAPEPEAPEPPIVSAPEPAPAFETPAPPPDAPPAVELPAALPPAADVPPAGLPPVAPPPTLALPAAEPGPATAAEAAPEPKSEKTPIWKKEIGFRRKPKASKQAIGGEGPSDAPAERPAPKRLRPRRERGSRTHKRLVGLKIGASQLAAARVVNNGSPELVQVARQPLERGVVVGGELRDPDALAEALKEFFRTHKLPRRAVRLGIANNRIGVRIFEISGIEDPKQLANAIRFRAQEALPIPIEEAVIDYHTLEETVDEEGVTTRRVLLVVAYRELIDRYVAACRKAGVKLVGIDLEAFALLRALGAPPEGFVQRDSALVVVSVGHERSTLAVSDGRVCEFTRVLDWGGSAVDVGLARALDIAPSEAEPIKLSLSLAGDDALPEGLSAEQAAKAHEAIRRELESFARELVSSLRFYQNQPGSLGIGEVVVTGGTAHLPGLGAELERMIGVSVRIGDPLARVKVGKKVKDREQMGSLAVAIGLGIED